MLIDLRERGRGGGERESDRNIDVREKHQLVASHKCPDQTRSLGMCPDWESNPQPFGYWDDTPPN